MGTTRWTLLVITLLGVARCSAPPAGPTFPTCLDGGVCTGGAVCCRDNTCRAVCPARDGGPDVGGGVSGGGAAGGGGVGGGEAGGPGVGGGAAGGAIAGGTAGGASAGGTSGGVAGGGASSAGGSAGGGSAGGMAAGPDGGCPCPSGQRCVGSACVACNPAEFSCFDAIDDDCDGLIDCVDPDCDARVCNDGNACTTTDRCANRVCTGTTTSCGAPPGTPSCYGPGTCLADGGCAFPFLSDAGCDDNDACTTGDRCANGTCQGTARSCPAPGPCFAGGGTCNPATGQCVFTAADAGAPCDDGNLCTHSDRCVDAGVCQGFPRCAFITNPCTTGVCDPSSGVCGTGTNLPNGTACTQEAFGGFGCPITGTCQNGSCMGTSPPVACNDFNACTTNDTCNAMGTCVGTPASTCDDGNPCTINDSCASGSCVGTQRTGACNDTNPCTANDTCTNGTCTGTGLTGGACDDNNPCTTNDVCQMGVCRGTNLPLNTPIGPRPTDRCCVGAFSGGVAIVTDISNSTSDCGGCGITCGGFLNFFGCVPTKGALTCGDPPSGRCACTGPFMSPAPNTSGWTCSPQGLWVPTTTAACMGGQLVSASGSCPAYCAP